MFSKLIRKLDLQALVIDETTNKGLPLTDDGGLEVCEDGPGHVLAALGLAEEGVEGVAAPAHRHVGGHLHGAWGVRGSVILCR